MQAEQRASDPAVLFRSLAQDRQTVSIGVLMVTMTTVSFYFITAYTPTFGREVLKLTGTESLLVTLCVGVSNLFRLPVMGALSDRVGRRPLLICFTVLMLVSAYPARSWLVTDPSFGRLLAVELWLSFLDASDNGAMIVALTAIIPVEVRTAGFSVAYSFATALFGGFTPAVSTFLIEITGNRVRRRPVADVRGHLRARRRLALAWWRKPVPDAVPRATWRTGATVC